MKIEIVEFYPLNVDKSANFFCGSLHIYLIEYGLDIRGINVIKKNNRWTFFLPHRKAKEEGTENFIQYPIINFTDNQKQQALVDFIRTKGKEYIQENFKELCI